jgi:hypothetical protein
LAFSGLAGDIVRAIAPQTEAAPVALLLSLLAAIGNIVGSGPHWQVGGSRHGLRVWPVLVGTTSRGRKGTAWSALIPLLALIAADWLQHCVASGLASGEGLMWSVRDAISRTEPLREGGRIVGYQEVLDDAGVDDKRLFVIEEEFSAPLQVMKRERNILSPVMRQAWDHGNLRTLTKNAPVTATGAHITITGHITQHELLRYLDTTEAGNGFANRFLWACVHRSQLLPSGGRLDEVVLRPLADRLGQVLATAEQIDYMARDRAAEQLWATIYAALSTEAVGLLGAITSRAEAQVMRLAAIYAVLERTAVIGTQHLLAAVALWDYLEASVEYIFGDALGNPIADAIRAELQQRERLTRTEMRDLFQRNVPAARIDEALQQLAAAGQARMTRHDTGGRPVEVWQLSEHFGRFDRFGRARQGQPGGILARVLDAPIDDGRQTGVAEDVPYD